MTEPAGRGSPRFPALRAPLFRRFLLALLVLTIGSFMQSTSQGWLVLELTDSPGLLGLVGAALGLPTLLLAALAGVLADRLDRRRLLVATSLAGAILSATLGLLTSSGLVEFWQVLVIAFLTGVVLTVQMPANQAVISTIVGREAIGNAIALNSIQYNLSRIVAPAVAGLAIAAGGLAFGFWANAAAMLVAAWLVAGLAITSPGLVRPGGRFQAALWADLADGVRFVTADRTLAVLVVLPIVPALCVLSYLTFLPVYARDILAIGPGGLGLLSSGIGVGALAGGLWVATFRPSGGSGRLVVGGLVVIGLALAVFAGSTIVPLSLVALAVLGACQVAYYATTNTLIQVLVPGRLRGRVHSLYVLTSIGFIPLGNLAGGALAERFGVPAVLVGGAIVTVIAALGAAVLERRLLRLRATTILAGR